MHQRGIKQLLIEEESLSCYMNYLPMATMAERITDSTNCYFD